LFQNVGFRKNGSGLSIYTEWYKWLALSADYSRGRGVDYYPGSGLPPFLGRSTGADVTLTLRASPRLRFDESYYYSRLGAEREWLPDPGLTPGAIFNNHILRSKVNYQFSRELSLRAIFDYNGVLPNSRLASLENSRRAGVDVLLTYLLHPGVAVYAGYSNTREKPGFRPAAVSRAAENPVPRYHYRPAGIRQAELYAAVLRGAPSGSQRVTAPAPPRIGRWRIQSIRTGKTRFFPFRAAGASPQPPARLSSTFWRATRGSLDSNGEMG